MSSLYQLVGFDIDPRYRVGLRGGFAPSLPTLPKTKVGGSPLKQNLVGESEAVRPDKEESEQVLLSPRSSSDEESVSKPFELPTNATTGRTCLIGYCCSKNAHFVQLSVAIAPASADCGEQDSLQVHDLLLSQRKSRDEQIFRLKRKLQFGKCLRELVSRVPCCEPQDSAVPPSVSLKACCESQAVRGRNSISQRTRREKGMRQSSRAAAFRDVLEVCNVPFAADCVIDPIARVDTGSRITLISNEVRERLQLPSIGKKTMRVGSDERIELDLVCVDMYLHCAASSHIVHLRNMPVCCRSTQVKSIQATTRVGVDALQRAGIVVFLALSHFNFLRGQFHIAQLVPTPTKDVSPTVRMCQCTELIEAKLQAKAKTSLSLLSSNRRRPSVSLRLSGNRVVKHSGMRSKWFENVLIDTGAHVSAISSNAVVYFLLVPTTAVLSPIKMLQRGRQHLLPSASRQRQRSQTTAGAAARRFRTLPRSSRLCSEEAWYTARIRLSSHLPAYLGFRTTPSTSVRTTVSVPVALLSYGETTPLTCAEMCVQWASRRCN